MTRKEELERVAEQVFARMTNDTLKKIGEKYDDFVKEKVENEFDRANKAIEEDNPEYGAIVVNLDGCELTFPFSDRTVIEIDNGDKKYSIDIKDDIDPVELFSLMVAEQEKCPVVKVTTQTRKTLEFYNKDKLVKENTKLKYEKDYVKTFEGVYPKARISAVYKVKGCLEAIKDGTEN